MTDKSFNFTFFDDCRKDLCECLHMYIYDIHPFIVLFETEKSEFPIELQNEIRSMYAHLCRAAAAEKKEEAIDNVKRIMSHSKRALLDCFKYISIVYTDMYNDFMNRYKSIDLTLINNGDFLREIEKTYKETKDKLQNAKALEVQGVSNEKLFELYQDAYLCARKIKSKIESVELTATYLKRRAMKKDILCVASFVIGILGLVVGVLGFVF